MASPLLQIAGLLLAGPSTHWVVEDPRYDDKGPGSYVYPTGQPYAPGSYDLRRFEVEAEGKFVIFRVTFGAPLKRPPEVRRSDAIRIELENEIYVQNVDIYVDQDPSPRSGVTEAVPGRNVVFAPEAAWEKVVILAPMPFAVRSALSGWAGEGRAIVPADLQGRGNTITARVPIDQLGGPPEPHWGYQVLIGGAVWDPSFDAVNRLFGQHRPNAFTMRVVTVPEPVAFGGSELGGYHPAVIDLLAPEGRSQTHLLKAFSNEDQVLAVLPMVYPNPIAFEAAQKAQVRPELPGLPKLSADARVSYIETRVKDVQGEIVVLERPEAEVTALSIGSVLTPEGEAVGQVVLTATYPDFLLATPVAGKERLKKGHLVRFQPPKE